MSYNYYNYENYEEERRRHLETQNIAYRYEIERERSNSFWNLIIMAILFMTTGHHGGN
jgi:hypothetical protein